MKVIQGLPDLGEVGPPREREFQMTDRFTGSRRHVCEQHPEVDVRLDAVRLNLHGRSQVSKARRLAPGYVHQQRPRGVVRAKFIGVAAPDPRVIGNRFAPPGWRLRGRVARPHVRHKEVGLRGCGPG